MLPYYSWVTYQDVCPVQASSCTSSFHVLCPPCVASTSVPVPVGSSYYLAPTGWPIAELPLRQSSLPLQPESGNRKGLRLLRWTEIELSGVLIIM